MDKFCPAGKIECKHYNGGSCYGGWHDEFVLNMPQCRWPSKQVPVDEIEDAIRPGKRDIEAEFYQNGRSDMKREIGEKVEKLQTTNVHGFAHIKTIDMAEMLVAIEGVK